MDTSFLTILPNLSIGVISILGLIYVVMKFLEALDKRAIQHSEAMQEREEALRGVEAEVRQTLSTTLSSATNAIQKSNEVLARVINHLDAN